MRSHFLPRVVILSLLLAFAGARPLLAGQHARVRVPQAQVLQSPEEGSPVVTSLPLHSQVRVSDRRRGEFYKVQLPGAAFGWIRSTDVYVENVDASLRTAGISTKDPVSAHSPASRIVARGFYRGNAFRLAELSTLAGETPAYFLGTGVGAEIGSKVGTDWVFSAGFESFSFSRTAKSGTFSGSGLALSGIADYLIVFAPPVRVFGGVGAGVSTGTSLVFDSTTSESKLVPMELIRLLTLWSPAQGIHVGLEVGYRFLSLASVKLGEATVKANLNSPFAGASISAEF